MSDYDPTQEKFDKDMANGVMEVLRDDGIYRHLRFRKLGGGFVWFDIVTWPGSLVITGDCKTFTFQRLDDMFEFFRSSDKSINPQYWQEKIVDGRDRAESFDWDTFRAQVMAEFQQETEDWSYDDQQEAREALEDDLDSQPDEYGGVDVLRNFEHTNSRGTIFSFYLNDGAPDGKDWDFHYIWCCRAIVWGIDQYDATKVLAA